MADETKNGKKIRSVDQYLQLLKLANKSAVTIKGYRQIFVTFAQFLNIPLEDIHNHLSVDNLLAFAEYRQDKAKMTRKTELSVLHRYMTLNGVLFDELEHNVVKIVPDEDRDDKPLDIETAQKMMDMGSPHAKALISFMCSTGCRAGETSKILLSDVDGDVVTIRNEIAKRRKGGKVFLTAEARQYLDAWLKVRDAYIAKSDKITSHLIVGGNHHSKESRKGTGTQASRPAQDRRLFACSYGTIDHTFKRLYNAVDGEQGKYRAKVTSHACRAFFRTNAPKGMSTDLTEGLLRHSGYLNQAYVRMTDADKYEQFKAGEAALYITRADHRIQDSKLSKLERMNQELRERLQQIENREKAIGTLDKMPLTPGDQLAIAKLVIALQKQS